jgi:hypothetical protein
MCAIVIGLCAASGLSAWAQCGLPQKFGGLAAAPAVESRPLIDTDPDLQALELPSNQFENPIVGLWDIKFLIGGQIGDEGFDQYHSDGMEILNDTPPPATGNVCLGVYVRTGLRSIKLKHPSWIYDSSNTVVIGTATILEDITVDRGGNTFTGTFTVQLRDLSGQPLGPDFAGDLKGTRITPQ